MWHHVSIFCHADIVTCMPCYNKIPHDMPPKPLPLQTNGRDQFKGQKTLEGSLFKDKF